MLVLSVPAKYAADVTHSIREIVARARMDDQLRGGVVPGDRVDRQSVGTLLVVVADLATSDARTTIADLAAADHENVDASGINPLLFSAGPLP